MNDAPTMQTPARSHRWRPGRPTARDVISGLVTGLFSIPEGMAYASIGGFNPVTGLYAGMAPTLVGSLFSRTVLMVTTLTSAIALSSQSVLTEAGLDAHDAGNLATLGLLVAVVMVLAWLLRLGSALAFVSTAVMTGFTLGIAVQIITGALKDATGYEPTSTNTVGKLVDSLIHVGSWQPTIVVVAVATVAVWFLTRLVKGLESYAVLVALLVVTAAVLLLGLHVPTAGDIATIPNALPPISAPDFAAVPHLATGAIAVALVALVQAAGIGAAVPNPDGSRTSANSDFLAQGLANAAGALTSALPTGGSLSRTGVATSAGASTRWTGIFAGAWLAILVLLAGSQAEKIPMAVIGGLVIVIGVELVSGRVPDLLLVVRSAPLPAVAMAVTFLATTALPLQQAIFIGAGLSLILFLVQVQRRAHIVQLERREDGRWQITPPPEQLTANQVTVLGYAGTGLFAELERVDEMFPRPAAEGRCVLILDMRVVPSIPSSTLLKSLANWSHALSSTGGRLYLAGLEPGLLTVLQRAHLSGVPLDALVPATEVLTESLDIAYNRATVWLTERPP